MFERGSSKFTWDPDKSDINYAKHRVDFIDATSVFDDPQVIEEPSSQAEHGEDRYLAVGRIGEKLYTVVFTYRGKLRRIISARRARDDERRKYDLRGTDEQW